MKNPLGKVLLKLGVAKVSKRNNLKESKRTDVLSDPFEVYANIKRGQRLLPIVPHIESAMLKLGISL